MVSPPASPSPQDQSSMQQLGHQGRCGSLAPQIPPKAPFSQSESRVLAVAPGPCRMWLTSLFCAHPLLISLLPGLRFAGHLHVLREPLHSYFLLLEDPHSLSSSSLSVRPFLILQLKTVIPTPQTPPLPALLHCFPNIPVTI